MGFSISNDSKTSKTVVRSVILLVTYLDERAEARRFAASLTGQMAGWTEAELHALPDPLERSLQRLQDWGERGLLDLDDRDRLNRQLAPYIERSGWISSIVLADTRREHMILQRPDGTWRGREIDRPGQARLTEWTDWQRAPLAELARLDYDPRRRPWYQGATAPLEAKGAEGEPKRTRYWTQPYRLFTTGELGVSVAGAFRAADGGRYVISLDMLLADVSAFTAALAVQRAGFVSVLTGDGRLLGLPLSPILGDRDLAREAILSRPSEHPEIPTLRVLAALLDRGHTPGVPVRIDVDGRPWWGTVAESKRISRGDLDPGPPIPTRIDEVRDLVAAHEQMRGGIQTRLKLEGDLRLAREIQQNTYPDTLPSLPGHDFAAWCAPADETGGDSYDLVGIRMGADGRPTGFEHRSPDQVAFMLAYAARHGVGPAPSVVQVRATLRMALKMTSDLPEVIGQSNAQFCEDLPDGRCVTAWFGLLDPAAGEFQSQSAGQVPLLHIRATTDEVIELAGDAPPLGIIDLQATAARPRVQLQPGDLFAVLSDGIYEAANADGEQFGIERARAVLSRHRDAAAADILAALRTAQDAFSAGKPPEDDRTILIIKRL